MIHTTHTVVAVVTDAALGSCPGLADLAQGMGEVRSYDDPAACLRELARETDVLFFLDARLAQDPGQTWITIFAASGIGPVLLVGDIDEHCAESALQAGADEWLPTSALRTGSGLRAAFARQLLASHTARYRNLSAELESFVRDSIHEFRTPLTAVHEFAAIISDGIGGPVTEKQSEYLEYILGGTDRMLELFDDFRDSIRARLGTLTCNRRPCDTSSLVQEVVDGAATDRVSYAMTVDPAIGQVHADEALLSRTLECLLQRAAKCTPRGGVVRVHVRQYGGDEVEFRITDQGGTPTPGDRALVAAGTVEDGLQRKSVTKVFGIGVELARALVAMHSCELSLSEEESGTGGTLSFRIANSPAAMVVS